MNERLLFLINGWAGKSHLLDTLMVVSAKYLIYALFLLVAGWMLYAAFQHEWRDAIFFGANLVVTVGILVIASKLYVDHRPFMDHHLTQLLPHASGKSFPSDHTTAAMAIALSFLLFTPYKKSSLLVLAAALLIGFARIFVGVHYPIDILGGIGTALIGAGLTYIIYHITSPAEIEYEPGRRY